MLSDSLLPMSRMCDVKLFVKTKPSIFAGQEEAHFTGKLLSTPVHVYEHKSLI